MELLLIDRNTWLNSLVRYKTQSPWGHVSAVIEGYAYEFGHDERRIVLLEDLLKEDVVRRATLFHLDMLGGKEEAEGHYKHLFDTSTYDVRVLTKLNNIPLDNRGFENIQTMVGMHTCSNMIAKVCNDIYDQVSGPHHIIKDMHWSQVVPGDYSVLEQIAELK